MLGGRIEGLTGFTRDKMNEWGVHDALSPRKFFHPFSGLQQLPRGETGSFCLDYNSREIAFGMSRLSNLQHAHYECKGNGEDPGLSI